MTEEQNVNVEVNKNEPVVSTIEDRAKEQGWRPKEEYDGDPTKWVSAETFVARGELIDRIESLGKELKTTKKAMDMLKEHHKQVKETEFKKAIEYLKAQKRQAYEQGDIDSIIDIDDKIAEVKSQASKREVLEEESIPPEFDAWTKKNTWYNNDKELKEIADDLGIAYANRTKKPPEEVLDYVEKQIKKMYPDKFSNPMRTKTTTVEGSGNKGTTNKEIESIELSEEERKVMNTFVRANIMSKEDYLRDLKSMRGQ